MVWISRKFFKLYVLLACSIVASISAIAFAQDGASLQEHGVKSVDTGGGAAVKEGPKTEPLSRWYVRLGASGVLFHPGATVSAAGSGVPGAAVTVSNRATATADVGYYFTKNIAASLTAGVPPRSTVSGAGSLAPYGNLGAIWYGPAILAVHYHFLNLGAFQPYVGVGATYLIVFKKHDEAIKSLMAHNDFSPITQAGADYMLNKKWGVFADCRQTWLTTDVHGSLEGAVPAKAHIKLYPTVVSAGVTYRF